jgi:hypothetical protein
MQNVRESAEQEPEQSLTPDSGKIHFVNTNICYMYPLKLLEKIL